MLAIVKKSEFEKIGRDARPGDLLDLNEYVSKNPALRAAAKRLGALFLVTVRPPKERLWLVALLPEPKYARGKYRADNETPILDITKLRKKLRFTTGKGISQKAGALGMSLQTPRTLTEDDVDLIMNLVGRADLAASTKKKAKPTKANQVRRATKTSTKKPRAVVSPSGDLDAASIVRKLGASFRKVRPKKHEKGWVQVEHVPSGTLFVAIDRATFQMGPSKRDAEAFDGVELMEGQGELARMAKKKRKTMKVAPFLCARGPVTGGLAEQVLGDMGWTLDDPKPELAPARVSPRDATKLARAFASDGLRLITDIEWELVARQGRDSTFVNADDVDGAEDACRALFANQRFDRAAKAPATNAFGVWGLPFGEFVAAPKGDEAKPWGVRGGAAMLYPWQTDEILMCLSSFGYRVGRAKDESGVRFAVDL